MANVKNHLFLSSEKHAQSGTTPTVRTNTTSQIAVAKYREVNRKFSSVGMSCRSSLFNVSFYEQATYNDHP